MFSSVRQGVFLHSSRRVFLLMRRKGAFAQSPLGFLLKRRKGLFAAPCFFAQSPQGLVAALSLKPRRLFISLHEQRNEAKKFAVCTFWATPALFSAKQKELASLKQLFVFYAPKSTSASRPKSEAGPFCFFATLLRSLGCDVFFLRFALLFTIFFISFRPPWRSVKKFLHFSVKNKKLFER